VGRPGNFAIARCRNISFFFIVATPIFFLITIKYNICHPVLVSVQPPKRRLANHLVKHKHPQGSNGFCILNIALLSLLLPSLNFLHRVDSLVLLRNLRLATDVVYGHVTNIDLNPYVII
jgi:hypothetical protein